MEIQRLGLLVAAWPINSNKKVKKNILSYLTKDLPDMRINKFTEKQKRKLIPFSNKREEWRLATNVFPSRCKKYCNRRETQDLVSLSLCPVTLN